MFQMTGSSMNTCYIALTLLLMLVFRFLTLISITYDSKEMVQYQSTKVDRHIYDIVRILFMIYKMLILLPDMKLYFKTS